MTRLRHHSRSIAVCAFLALSPVQIQAALAQSAPKMFSSPDAAAVALATAARQKTSDEILAILGPSSGEWLLSGDEVQDNQARERFAAAYDEKHVIKADGEGRATLEVGADDFPFPFPIVKNEKGWAFDAEEGKEELLNRRIGENELNAIEVLYAIADAQVEYASEDRDGDGLREYASKFRSSPDKQDGLFWATKENEKSSPLGSLLAEAADEGYQDSNPAPSSETAQAYHGYRYRILTRQAADAEGGAQNYEVDGGLLGGFAVLAYPAKYGASGIMSFMINQDGVIHEADLGEQTEDRAREITEFTTAGEWRKLPDDAAL